MAEQDILDIIIIGAGPCGLATAARLREQCPAALFTDEEHRRFHWINKHGKNVPLRHVKSGKHTGPRARSENFSMLILDAEGSQWLSRWKRLFSTYDIQHLRSPMLWHLDPLDRDALLGYAFKEEREGEMVEIRGCVGREVSKHARKKASGRGCGSKQDARVAINLRERNDYYTPSQALFCDHCTDIISRYRLTPDLLRQESLTDLDYDVVPGVSTDDEKLFSVTTSTGTTRYARAVVMAVGPANKPVLPILPSLQPLLDSGRQNLPCCHSMDITTFPSPPVQAKINTGKETRILVVGGGLTSAQLSDLAIRRGVTKVWHLMRGPLRVKHFDVDLSWMGKYKNAEQARFWTAEGDEERLEILKAARGGGSVTPVFYKRVRKHQGSGRLQLITETELLDVEYQGSLAGQEEEGECGSTEAGWKIKTSPPREDLPTFDHIYFATGIQSNISSLPYLKTLHQKYPISTKGGFPCLTEDLTWSKDVPLFMVGRMAALQLGPAAPNIGGAKLGAERVAWAVGDMARRGGWGLDGDLRGDEEEQEEGEGYGFGYSSGQGNMYGCLCEEGE